MRSGGGHRGVGRAGLEAAIYTKANTISPTDTHPRTTNRTRLLNGLVSLIVALSRYPLHLLIIFIFFYLLLLDGLSTNLPLDCFSDQQIPIEKKSGLSSGGEN